MMTLPRSALAVPSNPTVAPLPRVLRPQRALPSETVRPTRAEINLANLRHNLRTLERSANGAQIWAVLKADAYGHGSKAVARTLERAGVTGFCVALLEEGIELREAGIRTPILVMGGHYGRAWGELLHFKLTPVLHDVHQVAALAREASFASITSVKAHVKIDTGMGRLGILPNDVEALAEVLRTHPEVRLEGLMTHFACADSGDTESIEHQLDTLDDAAQILRRHGLLAAMRHAANSAALLASQRACLDMVRPGIAVFGVEPVAGLCEELRPVMQVRSELVAIRQLHRGQSVGYGATWTAKRPSLIATIPIGYADGLHRALSNRGRALVRGRSAPIVGLVSMDMTMLDVTDVPGATLGDECVVMGTQRGTLGQGTISAEELAGQINSVPWEVLTSISRRVPRFYREP